MSTRERIDTVYDFTDKGLVELKAWLEPWFLNEDGGDGECNCCPDTTTDFPDVIAGISDLYAYWRLGETGSPWADTSGIGTADDLVLTGAGATVNPDVVGALALGDDGAVELNYDGTDVSSASWLANSGIKSFENGSGGGLAAGFTVACWVKVKASALSREGMIIGNATTGVSIPYFRYGWGLEVVYPSRKIRFADNANYVETPTGVDADTWVFLVGTYGGGEIRLYVDGVLIGSDTGATGSAETSIRIGQGTRPIAAAVYEETFFYGSIDEAAVWSRVLTDEEITDLYDAGAGGVAGGMVFTTDGSGGCNWGYPTVKVDGARYSEILLGPGLTATDNGDGTVTIDLASP